MNTTMLLIMLALMVLIIPTTSSPNMCYRACNSKSSLSKYYSCRKKCYLEDYSKHSLSSESGLSDVDQQIKYEGLLSIARPYGMKTGKGCWMGCAYCGAFCVENNRSYYCCTPDACCCNEFEDGCKSDTACPTNDC